MSARVECGLRRMITEQRYTKNTRDCIRHEDRYLFFRN